MIIINILLGFLLLNCLLRLGKVEKKQDVNSGMLKDHDDKISRHIWAKNKKNSGGLYGDAS